ncbi:MAG: uroporphyrinogen decarboxylase family protein [Eubacteriales bacterium]|nr:uroporphyrinogen decarboxylase family protein [Eubacteriales bacterium]
MTAREIVKRRLNHGPTPVTPYSVSFEAGLYKKLTDYYADPDWESKKLRRFTCCYLDADTVLMEKIDDIYSRDGYGAIWDMSKLPWHLRDSPLKEPVIDKSVFPQSDKFVANILRQKKSAIKQYQDDTEHYRIINMGWGIFEHSWRMRGFENALSDMLLEADFYTEMTGLITDLYIEMLTACEDVPADAYLFGDDWGEQRGLIMGPASWRKFIKPCWARIYAEVHRQGKTVIQHSCGSIADIYDDLAEIGMDCHESVQPEAYGMEPSVLQRKWGDRIAFWGCLGSQSTLYSGSEDDIKNEIHRLDNIFKAKGGYVLAPAKPLTDDMPAEKAAAVVETLSGLSM